jgi:heme/copper-type cytochrome/quinol oxidase subunit 4
MNRARSTLLSAAVGAALGVLAWTAIAFATLLSQFLDIRLMLAAVVILAVLFAAIDLVTGE